MEKHSMNFGKKERVLNYACQTYQLSRPNKVGAVMALIRECQPKCFEEWEKWYFNNAHTTGKHPSKITEESLTELGERLWAKITEIVIPEWETAFKELTLQDCIDYIYNLTINRTYDGYVREKSVVNDVLANIFTDITFEETDPELDHAGDIDYIAKINGKAIGIQIKPITASANFGGYSLTERMKSSFKSFEEEYGGKVFIIFSLDGEIANDNVIEDIRVEIKRLKGQ
jgi:hypothetical protein